MPKAKTYGEGGTMPKIGKNCDLNLRNIQASYKK